MKNISKLLLFSTMIIFTSLFTACKDDDDNNNPVPVTPDLPKLLIEFDHMAGTEKFYLDSTYVNANGDSLTATLFKYYISNIRLVGTNNAEYKVPNSYYLINQEEEASHELHLTNLPAGLFKSIKFMIGVDSTRNVSGAQTGALDPLNGMFWSWNTGYIFMKIEGTSPVISGNTFTYHIGGFQGSNINYKEIELLFDGDILTLANNKEPELHLITDVLEIFTDPTTINMATFPSGVHMPNSNANTIAENYANMFSYDHMHQD